MLLVLVPTIVIILLSNWYIPGASVSSGKEPDFYMNSIGSFLRVCGYYTE